MALLRRQAIAPTAGNEEMQTKPEERTRQMERDPALDNAKFIAVALVIFGHFLELYIEEEPSAKSIYMSIYSFHVPVLVLLSGMLSKLQVGFPNFKKLTTSLLIPLGLFTLLYELQHLAAHSEFSNYTKNLRPFWLLWYLLSLFVWRCLLPFVLRQKYPLIISIIASLLSGFIDDVGYFLGVSRTIYFFPFFVLGSKLTPEFLTNKTIANIPPILPVAVLALNFYVFSLFSTAPHEWLYGSFSYTKLHSEGWQAAFVRLSIYTLSASTAISFLLLTPRKKFFFTHLGSNSLYAYLWHGFWVIAFHDLGIGFRIEDMPFHFILVLLLVISLALSVTLSLEPVAKLTQKLLREHR